MYCRSRSNSRQCMTDFMYIANCHVLSQMTKYFNYHQTLPLYRKPTTASFTAFSSSHSFNAITTSSYTTFSPFPLITSSSSFMCGMKSMVKLAMECLSSFSKHSLSDTHWQKELCSALSTRETRSDRRLSECISFSRVEFVLVGSL